MALLLTWSITMGLLALVASWLLVRNNRDNRSQRRDEKCAIDTWEGEGGNLPETK